MTKPMNTIGRKTIRRENALERMLRHNPKPDYFNRDKEIKTLQDRIALSPTGKVSTKKNRSDKDNAR